MATRVSRAVDAGGRRVVLFVGLAAAAAAAAVVGATLLQTRGERTTLPGAVTAPRPGRPPLQLELGLRRDPEARALERAETLYARGRVGRAAAIFRRYRSLEAELGAAFASWHGPASLGAVRRLAAAHPDDPAALLNLGWAEYQAGRDAAAAAAWQRAARLGRNSPYGVDAEDALHGGPAGLPPLVTGLGLPKGLAKLPPPQQLAALRRAARRADPQAKLRYGLALWDLRLPVSAERLFAAAARLAPRDPLARTAAAVGRFWKDNPTPAFAALGPLTAVFPRSPAVQFELGVLLLYIGERGKAADHLRAALADGPRSVYARPARTLLASLARARS
ncbi:MAG TPA: tetratricopeptide repeat protein [Gaiellaceae bacterium]|nr:tetratricopeptide repeat protein [Gaiellaceae bacterium]